MPLALRPPRRPTQQIHQEIFELRASIHHLEDNPEREGNKRINPHNKFPTSTRIPFVEHQRHPLGLVGLAVVQQISLAQRADDLDLSVRQRLLVQGFCEEEVVYYSLLVSSLIRLSRSSSISTTTG